MRNIYIGYSNVLSAEPLREYFHFDSDYESGSKFTDIFKSTPIGPGDYEVYGRAQGDKFGFGKDNLQNFFPFTPGKHIIDQIEFDPVKSVFYFQTGHVGVFRTDEIELIGSVLIDKFDFEIEPNTPKPKPILL